jgi:hypothetical protein
MYSSLTFFVFKTVFIASEFILFECIRPQRETATILMMVCTLDRLPTHIYTNSCKIQGTAPGKINETLSGVICHPSDPASLVGLA